MNKVEIVCVCGFRATFEDPHGNLEELPKWLQGAGWLKQGPDWYCPYCKDELEGWSCSIAPGGKS